MNSATHNSSTLAVDSIKARLDEIRKLVLFLGSRNAIETISEQVENTARALRYRQMDLDSDAMP